MQKIKLYRYTRTDGGVTTSPVQPEGVAYDIICRLIADEGMMLTDGEAVTHCVDVEEPDGWDEIEDPGEPEENTAEDYQDTIAAIATAVLDL